MVRPAIEQGATAALAWLPRVCTALHMPFTEGGTDYSTRLPMPVCTYGGQLWKRVAELHCPCSSWPVQCCRGQPWKRGLNFPILAPKGLFFPTETIYEREEWIFPSLAPQGLSRPSKDRCGRGACYVPGLSSTVEDSH